MFKKLSISLLVVSLLAPSFPSYAAGPDQPGGQGQGGHGGGNHGGGGGHGGPGPSPSPAPTPDPTPAPAPTPDPTPTPVVPSGPTASQIDAARSIGQSEGTAAGGREAGERAFGEGRHDGARDGHSRGFERCSHEESERAHDAGYRDGYASGQNDGNQAGAVKGQVEGTATGQNDGSNDGRSRADTDAQRNAVGPGQQQGIAQANASDANSSGISNGTRAGDSDAQAQANSVDYQRGRSDYRAQVVAEPVQNQDSFNQKSPVGQMLAKLDTAIGGGLMARISNLLSFSSDVRGGGDHHRDGGGDGDNHATGPDHRYANPTRTFPSSQEQEAYRSAYMSGYDSGFASAYNPIYQQAYAETARDADQQGCEEARHRDYRDDYSRGQGEGRQAGYTAAYNLAYKANYDANYRVNFRASSDSAYQANYQAYYAQHFEEARAAAYKSQYDSIYSAAYNAAHDQKYAAVYPQYAAAAYARGQRDEAANIAQRPVTLESAQATETIVNGVYEPGEPLRVKLAIRNLVGSSLDGRDVQVQVTALDSSAAVVSIGQESLVKGLRAKSLTTVSEALEFRMNDNAVNRASQLQVSLIYQGKPCGSQVINVNTKYMVDVSLDSAPVLKQGIQTMLAVRVKNQSNAPTDAGLNVSLTSRPDVMEVVQAQVAVGMLGAGEEKVIQFPVIARAAGSEIEVPLALQAVLGSGRRVGAMSSVEEVPLRNDYRIDVSPVSMLRSAGVVRVQYTITNVSSRLLMNGLQLKASIINGDASNFVVIGPNPQYLTPLLVGGSLSFDVPVLVKAGNSGGTLQLEVDENGSTVVINRIQF